MPRNFGRVPAIRLIPPRKVLTLAALMQLTPAYGAIGTIDALAGDVRVLAGGVEVPARPGFTLNEGDIVRTGPQAWAVFVMSDAASVVLRPDSQLRFDIYRCGPAGDVTRNCCLLSLIKGAFRFVTGFIGRNSRSNSQVTTPNVQIGIRG